MATEIKTYVMFIVLYLYYQSLADSGMQKLLLIKSIFHDFHPGQMQANTQPTEKYVAKNSVSCNNGWNWTLEGDTVAHTNPKTLFVVPSCMSIECMP